MEVKQHKFEGVYIVEGKICTLNLTPGKNVYGEKLFKIKEKEYREWIPSRSKLCAAIKKGIKNFPFKKGSKVLYLGAGTGTTISHISDIIGLEGIIYAIEISERPLRELISLAEIRPNIIPILADARLPETYQGLVAEKVDIIYEDVADPDQIKILMKNSERFLKEGGIAEIAIKSQSISSTKSPREVYRECLQELGKRFEILDKVELDPYEKFHLFVVLRKP
ncbi:MAG: fibrillarin-like rRNA/tRNA 2'-O-methyltransferase [Candidatus Aenigmarchaeota archaeon]|nr:fibrillarin-like rRNA/tRNA 2'-O-methyltransferase [Candidatus Aenigmarchaeota archaeon]